MTNTSQRPSTTAAVTTLLAQSGYVRDAIRAYSDNGDITSCDILHEAVGILEAAAGILAGEDDTLNRLLSGEKN